MGVYILIVQLRISVLLINLRIDIDLVLTSIQVSISILIITIPVVAISTKLYPMNFVLFDFTISLIKNHFLILIIILNSIFLKFDFKFNFIINLEQLIILFFVIKNF